MNAPLTFAALRAANVARQEIWCPEQKPDLSFRGNELAGEVGEACNVIKKLERERQGWRGSRATKGELASELADVVICADLVAQQAGIDLGAAVAYKFDATSEKNSLPTRLTGFGQTGEVKLLYFTYRNYRGEVSERAVVPLYIWHGATDWHPEAQWLLRAFDAGKREDRDFAMADMGDLRNEREAPERLDEQPEYAAKIAAVIAEEGEDGAACGWRPCTGCHETNEGYSTGHYHHSKTFKCDVGSGCHECGGLGVVWEHYPAAALKAMAADLDGGDDQPSCLGCARQLLAGEKVQDEAGGEIFCEACAYTYGAIKAQHEEAVDSGTYGELDLEGIEAFSQEYAAHIVAGGSPEDKPLYVLGEDAK